MAKSVEWIIKASRNCNLRCRYCYEWEELGNRQSVDLTLWRKIFTAVKDYRRITEDRTEDRLYSTIVWHGGEPLLHSASYWQAVLKIQHDLLPEEWHRDGTITNAIQTNLYSVSDDHLALIKENDIAVGVSCDFVAGARLSAGGREALNKVLKNLDRLEAAEIPYGFIVVLAAHTRPYIDEIMQRLADRGIGFRILPLYKGPDSRPMEGLELSNKEIVETLKPLFVRWFEEGCPVDVAPLSDSLWPVIMQRLGMRRKPFDRRTQGEAAIVVKPDGRLYEAGHRFGDECKYYGDLNVQSMADVLQCERYAASLANYENDAQRICGDCEFLGACNTFPAFAVPDGGREMGVCQLARPLMTFIGEYLDKSGLDRKSLEQLANEWFNAELAVTDGIWKLPINL